jgi:hypothetical protein
MCDDVSMEINYKRFWRWCIALGRTLDIVSRPNVFSKNTTFRKLDLFPSSGKMKVVPTVLGTLESVFRKCEKLCFWENIGIWTKSIPASFKINIEVSPTYVKMAVYSLETLATMCHKPEDHNQHLHCQGNLKCGCMTYFCSCRFLRY